MIKAASKRTYLVTAFIAILCSAALFVPLAFGLPYTHSEKEADAGHGVIHVAVTLDSSAVGGPTKAVWLPVNADDATVEAVMNEFLNASEDKSDRFAHEDYAMESMADYLSGREYTIAVYKAGAQAPGTDGFAYTSASAGSDAGTTLESGDGIYVTVTK